MPLDAPAAPVDGDPAAPDLAARQAEQFRIAQQKAALLAEQTRTQSEQQTLSDQNQQRTMAGDVTSWTQKPEYQVPWAQAPAEAKSHFNFDVYGAASAAAPEEWNANVAAQTGKTPATAQEQFEAAKVGTAPQPGESTTDLAARMAAMPGMKASRIPPAIMDDMVKNGYSPYDEKGNEIPVADALQQYKQFKDDNNIETPGQVRTGTQVAQLVNSSRNPAVSQYMKLRPVYDSIIQNATEKQMDQRDGVDDAYLINAAAGLESGGSRASTQNDYKEMLRAAGIRGDLDVMAERLFGVANNDPAYYQYRGTRILTDPMVQQIAENAKRIIKPRTALYLKAVQPFRDRLKDAGLKEEDYLGPELTSDAEKLMQEDQPPANQGGQNGGQPPAGMVQMTSPDGVVGYMPQQNVEAAKAKGYK